MPKSELLNKVSTRFFRMDDSVGHVLLGKCTNSTSDTSSDYPTINPSLDDTFLSPFLHHAAHFQSCTTNSKGMQLHPDACSLVRQPPPISCLSTFRQSTPKVLSDIRSSIHHFFSFSFSCTSVYLIVFFFVLSCSTTFMVVKFAHAELLGRTFPLLSLLSSMFLFEEFSLVAPIHPLSLYYVRRII